MNSKFSPDQIDWGCMQQNSTILAFIEYLIKNYKISIYKMQISAHIYAFQSVVLDSFESDESNTLIGSDPKYCLIIANKALAQAVIKRALLKHLHFSPCKCLHNAVSDRQKFFPWE